MNLWRKLYYGRTNFDFVGNSKKFFIFSGVAVAISLLSLGIRGLNLGVDFEGGTVIQVENVNEVSVGEVRSALSAVGQAGARVQSVSGGEGVRVQTVELMGQELQDLVAAVSDVSGVAVVDVSVQTVGPTFGSQVAEAALRALVIFLVVITIFIAFRFEWRMALIALAALFHDLILTTGVYSLVGFEVTPATVIAVLTILGYSLYDTVVVFDKVEEHIEDAEEKRTITGIVNLSMNQVLMRSINTSLTSLLPVGSLLFVGSFLLGAATLREFALALFVGISAGTYSSIFFASPLLALWKERQQEWQVVQRRVARRAGRAATPAPSGSKAKAKVTAPAEAGGLDAAGTEAAAAAPEPEIVTGTGATPRPPKKRRKKR